MFRRLLRAEAEARAEPTSSPGGSREWRASYNKGFQRLSEEIPRLACVGVYAGDRPLKAVHGTVYPYAEFLRRLWDGTLIR